MPNTYVIDSVIKQSPADIARLKSFGSALQDRLKIKKKGRGKSQATVSEFIRDSPAKFIIS